MVHLRNRKQFVNTLGVAGLGLGLLAGAPWVMAQEKDGALALQGDADCQDVVAHRLGGERGGHEDLRVAAYKEFTQALADELGIADADEVDAAIRGALLATVAANDGLSKDGKEEMKALIADADAPIGPTIRGWGG